MPETLSHEQKLEHLNIEHAQLKKEHELRQKEIEHLRQQHELSEKTRQEQIAELNKRVEEITKKYEEVGQNIKNVLEHLPKDAQEIKQLEQNIVDSLKNVDQSLNKTLVDTLNSQGISIQDAVVKSQDLAREALAKEIQLAKAEFARNPQEKETIADKLNNLAAIKTHLEETEKQRSSEKWFFARSQWNASTALSGFVGLLSLALAIVGVSFGCVDLEKLAASKRDEDAALANRLKEWLHLPEERFWSELASFVGKQGPLVYEQVRFLLAVKEMMIQMGAPNTFHFSETQTRAQLIETIKAHAQKEKKYTALYQFVSTYRYRRTSPDGSVTQEVLPRAVTCQLLVEIHGSLVSAGVNWHRN